MSEHSYYGHTNDSLTRSAFTLMYRAAVKHQLQGYESDLLWDARFIQGKVAAAPGEEDFTLEFTWAVRPFGTHVSMADAPLRDWVSGFTSNGGVTFYSLLLNRRGSETSAHLLRQA